jgi:nucleoside-diphosphate-sugar epimerase
VYGSRNQVTLPELAKMLRRGQLMILGSGRNRLGLVHVADVARAFLLAGHDQVAAGRPYVIEGVAGRPTVTQSDYLYALADLVGAPRPGRHVPFGAALALGTAAEITWHLLGRYRRPPLSSFIVHLLGRDQHFDTSRAQSELGWKPLVGFESAMQETQAWLHNQNPNRLAKETAA